VLARRITGQDAETAFFAGIVHEIGGFYLLSRATDYPDLLPDEADRTAATEASDAARAIECEVGLAVLRRLDVPAPVIDAVEAHWRGFLGMPPRTLADTLLLADYLAPLASPLGWSPTEGGRAALDFAINAQTLSETLAESAAEVDSLAAALRG
jgi:HD-like signal output (HDOD) protein